MRSTETTRRKFIGAGVATGGALLAGCITGGETDGSSGETYTVSMEPMGEVEFEGPPERWTALLPSYADMNLLGGAARKGLFDGDSDCIVTRRTPALEIESREGAVEYSLDGEMLETETLHLETEASALEIAVGDEYRIDPDDEEVTNGGIV